MLKICAKLRELIPNGIKVIERTLFLYGKLQRGNNSAKYVNGVTVISLCTSSGHFFISTKFCEIILNGIKFRERTRFYTEDYKGE